jgi:hypothetical protein
MCVAVAPPDARNLWPQPLPLVAALGRPFGGDGSCCAYCCAAQLRRPSAGGCGVVEQRWAAISKWSVSGAYCPIYWVPAVASFLWSSVGQVNCNGVEGPSVASAHSFLLMTQPSLIRFSSESGCKTPTCKHSPMISALQSGPAFAGFAALDLAVQASRQGLALVTITHFSWYDLRHQNCVKLLNIVATQEDMSGLSQFISNV